jgi:zinc/manganese transport system substrate-binding protein
VPLLDKLTESDHVDRSMGDIHPEGNPHTHLNPYNLLLIAKELNKRLKIIDSKNADFYQKNYDNFITKWQKSIKSWELQAKKLKKLVVITYHKSFDYLLDWLRVNEIATVEAKPGLPPTTKHLKKLLKIIKESPQSIIIRTAYDNNKATKWLNKKTNIKIETLPYTVGSTEEVTDLFSLFEQIIISLNKHVQ